MHRSRILMLGCAVAVVATLAACGDPIVPKQSNGGVGSTPSQLIQLVGVVELIDENQYGLRQADLLIHLIYSGEGFEQVLGMEVIVSGTFTASGGFSVSSWGLAPDPVDELYRVPATRKPSEGRSRR